MILGFVAGENKSVWPWDVHGLASNVKSRISDRMNCKESVIFLANLAYIPHVRQNHSTFPPNATKINLNKESHFI